MSTHDCRQCIRTFPTRFGLSGHMRQHKAKPAVVADPMEETYNKFHTYINKLQEENSRLKKLLAKWEELAGRLLESNNR